MANYGSGLLLVRAVPLRTEYTLLASFSGLGHLLGLE